MCVSSAHAPVHYVVSIICVGRRIAVSHSNIDVCQQCTCTCTLQRTGRRLFVLTPLMWRNVVRWLLPFRGNCRVDIEESCRFLENVSHYSLKLHRIISDEHKLHRWPCSVSVALVAGNTEVFWKGASSYCWRTKRFCCLSLVWARWSRVFCM